MIAVPADHVGDAGLGLGRDKEIFGFVRAARLVNDPVLVDVLERADRGAAVT